MQRTTAASTAQRAPEGQIEADVWRDNEWFVARARGVEVASQGKTRAEAIANLREALEPHFEDPGRYTAASVGSSGARTCCRGGPGRRGLWGDGPSNGAKANHGPSCWIVW